MATGLFNLKQVNQAISQSAWVTGTKPTYVDFLVVAGGAGAGAVAPGGGGAGGLLIGSTPVVSGSAITVTVGAGGSGTSGSSAPGNGTNSVFGSQIAIGGGKGGNNGIAPGSGGSGGGTGQESFGAGQGTVNQGFRGGQTFQAGGGNGTSGGGGAGGVGQSPIAYNAGGQGGNGLGSVITGTMTGYGGGGSGCTGNTGSGTSPAGVPYGGGSTYTGGNGGSGDANTGGGGSAGPNYTGGYGGSGIVVISYPDVYAAPTATTGSPTVSTSGSGSLLLNSGSYVKYPNNAAFTLAGDFTIEGFFNTTSTANPYFWSLGDDATSAGLCLYYSSAGGVLRVYTNGGAPLNGVSILTNTWYHLSLVRSGSGANNVVLYVNGTSAGSMTNTATFNGVAGNGFAVGAEYNTGAFGTSPTFYSSNIRVVKGTAIVPPAGGPTAPLTPVTNTSFLMNTVSGAYLVDSSSSSLTATVVNTSAWNAASPFTGTGYKNRVYKWTSSGSITF